MQKKRTLITIGFIIFSTVIVCGYYILNADDEIKNLPVAFGTDSIVFIDRGLFKTKEYRINYYLGHWNYQTQDGKVRIINSIYNKMER